MSMATPFILAILSLSFLCICQADLISRVCSETTNPPLCLETLGSDTRARGADLRGLGQIIVEKSIGAVQDLVTNAKSIGGEKADTCIEVSDVAVDDLNQCVSILKQISRATGSEILSLGSDVLRNVATCDREFGSGEPATLKAASKKVQDLVNVLLVIGGRL